MPCLDSSSQKTKLHVHSWICSQMFIEQLPSGKQSVGTGDLMGSNLVRTLLSCCLGNSGGSRVTLFQGSLYEYIITICSKCLGAIRAYNQEISLTEGRTCLKRPAWEWVDIGWLGKSKLENNLMVKWHGKGLVTGEIVVPFRMWKTE